jgi:hypothetical protein
MERRAFPQVKPTFTSEDLSSFSLANLLRLLQPAVLREVTLEGGQKLSAAVVTALLHFPQLTSLALDCRQLPINTTATIDMLAKLRSLRCSTHIATGMQMRSIARLRHLTGLEIRFTALRRHRTLS